MPVTRFSTNVKVIQYKEHGREENTQMKKLNNKNKIMLMAGYLLVVLALLLSACGASTPEPTPEPPTAAPVTEEPPEIMQPIARWNSVSEAGTWVLIGYGDALNPTVVEPGTYVTINFSAIDDTVNGSGGCNTYNTTYTADDQGSLNINGPIATTMMACETGAEQEGLFLGALEAVSGYTLTDDGHLLLNYDSGTVYDEQLNFVRETQLVGTNWVLTGYGDPNHLTASQAGVMTTAVFSADGTLNGSGGCNQYSAGYTIQDGQIGFNLPVSTLMACDIGGDQEQAFLTILENAASYRLGLGALDIITTDGSNMLRFSAQHQPLENVRWQLASIDGVSVPEGLVATVLFTPAGTPANQSEENSITGGGGCNNFFGSYTITGDTFTAGPFGVTQSMCDEAIMQVEGAFLAGLENPQSYQISLNQLIINTAGGSLLLYADRMPLEGPQWVLTATGPVDNPQPPLAGSEFTAKFDRQFGMPSGVKSGGTGCNDYTATYYASANEIKVNLPATTQNTCTAMQSEAEQGYFLGLNSARNYRIIGNEMYIYYDNLVHVFQGSYPSVGGPLTILDGTQWWLVSIDTFLLVPSTEVTISFSINPDGSTGTINGSGGCNTYSAQITGHFALSPINATSALCDVPAGVMEQEAAYFNALGTANGIFMEGDTLRITTILETLIFTNVGPSPEQPLPVTPTPEVSQPLPITAVINAPTEGQANQPITFDGSLSSSNVDITAYSWTFGDDTSAEGATVDHTYTAAGSYDVILTVTDANGQSASASFVLTIQ